MKDHSRVARIAPDVSINNVSLNQDGADACELLVAELQSRRERLHQLLRLVAIEVERQSQVRRPGRTRLKCRPVAAS